MLALLPLLLSLAPSLIGALAGDKAGTITGEVIDAAKRITGAATEADAAAVIATDPAKAAELQIALARIAADAKTAQDAQETARLQAVLADTANARANGNTNSLVAKAQVGLAGALVFMFAATLIFVIVHGIPYDNGSFTLLFGALIAAQQAVISFFFGNSTSAHSANNAMANLAQRLPITETADTLNGKSLANARGVR